MPILVFVSFSFVLVFANTKNEEIEVEEWEKEYLMMARKIANRREGNIVLEGLTDVGTLKMCELVWGLMRMELEMDVGLSDNQKGGRGGGIRGRHRACEVQRRLRDKKAG
ncbi:hypothetical protein DL96DRAFT_1688137 [Flagelloscypha sp. PMI_526]|nr:hypothetical protein DL96DRAFT_1688137 [Flagelloscypha sp. PMI_526]